MNNSTLFHPLSSSSNKRTAGGTSINGTDHTVPIDDSSFLDYYNGADEDDLHVRSGEQRGGSCDHVCLVETPLNKILSPLASLFKKVATRRSFNVDHVITRRKAVKINVDHVITRRKAVKINVDHVITKCFPGDLGRDDAEIERLRKLTEDIPELMRVCRSNSVAFDSVRSLETFNA